MPFSRTSPKNNNEFRQYTNDLLLERNNLFQMDLIDLKVKFADLVSLVQARQTTNWIKGYEQISKSKIDLTNTLDDLERFKSRIEESLRILQQHTIPNQKNVAVDPTRSIANKIKQISTRINTGRRKCIQNNKIQEVHVVKSSEPIVLHEEIDSEFISTRTTSNSSIDESKLKEQQLKHEQILKQQEAMLKTQQQRILKQKQEEIDLIRNYQTRIAKSVILKLLKKKLLTAWRTQR